MEGEFHPAGEVESFPVGRGRTVTIEGRCVAVFRTEDRFHALDGLCPHQNAELSLGDLRGGIVTCPMHGWRFELETGASPDTYQPGVRVHDTKIEEGVLYVALTSRPPS